MVNAVLAFPIVACMFRSDPSSLLMLLPRYAMSFISSISSPSSSILSGCIPGVDPHHLCLGFPDPRPVCIEIFASLVSLDCMLWWLCERGAMSSSRVARVHCMPSRCLSVVFRIIQSMTSWNKKGDIKQTWRNSVSISNSSVTAPLSMTLQVRFSSIFCIRVMYSSGMP